MKKQIMQKKYIFLGAFIISIVLVGCFFVFNYESSVRLPQKITAVPISALPAQDIKKDIVYGFKKNQLSDGLLPYEFDFAKGSYTKLDNIIKQTEVALVYLDFLDKNPDDTSIKTALTKLLNGLTSKLTQGEYGLQLTIDYNEGDYKNLSDYEVSIIKQKRLRAEISATSLFLSSLSKYRILYESLDFATTESYLIKTLMKVAERLISSKQTLDPIYKYPPYELWYALSVYQENTPKNRDLDKTLVNLDRFFASIEDLVKDKDSLFYFLASFDKRKEVASNYVVGSVLRNLRSFSKDYVNNYDSSALDCDNGKILNESLKLFKFLDRDKNRIKQLNRYINTSKKNSLKFFINGEKDGLTLGLNPAILGSDLKKFTGFFVSGYGNPITTIKNSISCYYTF